MSRLFKACITDNIEVAEKHYLISLAPLDEIPKPNPGNFFMLSIDNDYDPLLKRPFSVHRFVDGSLQILYRVVGRGTALLSTKQPGTVLDLIGPLGNEFSVRKGTENIILIAGGLGIAPIFALAEKILTASPSLKKGVKKLHLFYGARTGDELLCMNALSAIGIDPIISTDDGSTGHKGNIVDVLKKHITRHPSLIPRHCLFACGPEPMLRSLAQLAVKNTLQGYVALEQNMGCGIGTCLGCVVHTKKGYKRVCKEGPVFPIEDIVWE